MGARRCSEEPSPPLPIVPTPQPAQAPEGLEIRHIGTGEALFTARAFAAGEPLFEFERVSWRPRRDRYTVETPEGQHLYDPILARVAHGCDPAGRISFRLMALVARRDIAAGEMVTTDYLATETAIADPFDCHCGAANCRRRVQTPPFLPPQPPSAAGERT